MRIARDNPGAYHCTVFLNGQQVRHVVAADESEGWVQRAEPTPCDLDGERRETLHGAVRLEFDSPQWRQVAVAWRDRVEPQRAGGAG